MSMEKTPAFYRQWEENLKNSGLSGMEYSPAFYRRWEDNIQSGVSGLGITWPWAKEKPEPTAEPEPMSDKERQFWNDVFKLMSINSKIINFLDGQAALELPPAFINEPWYYGDNPRFPDYKTLREDYQAAAGELFAEYQRRTGAASIPEVSGLGQVVTIPVLVAVAFVTTSVVLVAWLVSQTPTEREAKAQAALVKVETEYIREMNRIVGDPATRRKLIKEGSRRLTRLAKQVGMTLPKFFKEALDVTTVALVAAGLWIGYKLFRG